MPKKYEVLLTETFKRRYQKIKNGKQKEIILKFFDKLRDKGTNAIKILYLVENYILGEMKSYEPPYRLYVVLDQEDSKFYIIDWEHKNRQQQIIVRLKSKLKTAIKIGLEAVF